MKLIYTIVCVLFSQILFADAAETYGGRIWVRCIGGITYEINIHLSSSVTTPSSYMLDIGYGNYQSLTQSSLVQSSVVNGTIESDYMIQHVYSPGIYNVRLTGDSRSEEIENIPQSVTTQFAIATGFTVDPNIGCSSTPWSDASDCYVQWTSGQMNTESMIVSDGDGDSIAWNMVSPVAGYTFPSQVGSGPFTYSQSAQTFSWDPVQAGLYTVVFEFEEWHALPNGNRVLIGTALREILIDVDGVVGLESTQGAEAVLIYPNPAGAELRFSETLNHVELLNAQGEVILSETRATHLDVSGLAEGIYFLKADELRVKKVVVGR